jgi:hypothetical protein
MMLQAMALNLLWWQYMMTAPAVYSYYWRPY